MKMILVVVVKWRHSANDLLGSFGSLFSLFIYLLIYLFIISCNFCIKTVMQLEVNKEKWQANDVFWLLMLLIYSHFLAFFCYSSDAV